MKTTILKKIAKAAVLFIMAFQYSIATFASHAAGADITYKWLGGNQYQITLSFYRDCSGINAPNSVSINCSSSTCSQDFNVTLNPIAGTGQEVGSLCPDALSTCDGGTLPGFQKYVYQGTVVLPQACSDWIFSYDVNARNPHSNVIGTGDLYVEAHLDNLDAPGHDSPYFTNDPVAFTCAGQLFCYNHGAVVPNGDSLSYQFITPMTGPNSYITYAPGFSATQPISSNPAVSLNPVTGDVCMTPTGQQTSAMAIKVTEWENGVAVGSVIRDIQLAILPCSNDNPYLTGINGTGIFEDTVCAGTSVSFNIPSNDIDAGQILTMTWNNSISGATFNPGSGNHPTGSFSWTPSLSDAGHTYCFTVTIKDNNCPLEGFQTYSFCIRVNGGYQVNVITQDMICNSLGSASLNITGGKNPFTYDWSNGTTDSTDTGLVSGSYSVTLTDSTGCQQTIPFNIAHIGDSAQINLTATNVSCYGDSDGGVMAIITNGQQPYSYLWSNNATTVGINNVSASTYWIRVTTSQGCVSTDTVNITQPAKLNITNISKTDVLCNGGANGTATVTTSGGTPAYSYSWNSNPSQTTQQAIGLSPGNYKITVTDANGCIDTQSVVITQPTALQIADSSADVSCPGGNDGMAKAIISGGTPGYTYAWNTTPVQNSAQASNLPSGIYAVTVTDNNGCTATHNVTINEPAPFNVTVSSFSSVTCFGGNNGSISINTSGGTPGYTYAWNTTPIQTTNSATNLTAGSYSVVITDQNGCTYNYSTNISQPTQLNLVIQSLANVTCSGDSNGSASVVASGGVVPYTYSWNTNPVQNSNSAANLPAGNYQAVVTDANGCMDTSFITIVAPNPIYTTVQPKNITICPGNSVVLTASAVGGLGSYIYHWNDGYLGNPRTVTPTEDTMYTVQASDANGCFGTIDTMHITVNDISKVNLQLYGDTICLGETAQIGANVMNGIGNYSYQWANNIGVGPGPINVSPTQNTFYTVTITDVCGNTRSDSTLVIVNPLPQVLISPRIDSSCGTPISFSYSDNVPTAASDSYYWDFGDGTSSAAENGTKTYDVNGTYQVILTVTTSKGCSSSDTTTYAANINPVAKPYFVANPDSISVRDGHIYFDNQSQDANSYHWNFGDGDTSNLFDPTHHYTNRGTYTVTLYANNEHNCPGTYTHEVKIIPDFEIFIPNAFTPDGDGLNDTFYPKMSDENPNSYSLYIFNRWGQVIFESHHLEMGWDGRVKGKMSEEGVYVYKVIVKDLFGQTHSYTGSVTLVR